MLVPSTIQISRTITSLVRACHTCHNLGACICQCQASWWVAIQTYHFCMVRSHNCANYLSVAFHLTVLLSIFHPPARDFAIYKHFPYLMCSYSYPAWRRRRCQKCQIFFHFVSTLPIFVRVTFQSYHIYMISQLKYLAVIVCLRWCQTSIFSQMLRCFELYRCILNLNGWQSPL